MVRVSDRGCHPRGTLRARGHGGEPPLGGHRVTGCPTEGPGMTIPGSLRVIIVLTNTTSHLLTLRVLILNIMDMIRVSPRALRITPSELPTTGVPDTGPPYRTSGDSNYYRVRGCSDAVHYRVSVSTY